MSYRSPWYAPSPTLPYAPEYGFLGHVPANAIRGPGYTFVPGVGILGEFVRSAGAAGNVGAYAVQLAVNAGLQVIGVVGSKDIEYVKALGSQTVVNYQSSKFQNAVRPVDLVLDTVGGETRERSYSLLKSGGALERAANSSSSVIALLKCKIGLRVTSPRGCKIGLSNHSRIWPEQIELFVFQSFFEQSCSASSTC